MNVTLHRNPALLPEAPLSVMAPLSTLCVRQGLETLRAAAGFIQSLPFGRTTRRDDPALVLAEGVGTCSSKHALVAELAAEAGVEVVLIVGTYRMSAETDPRVGPVLRAHGIDWLPEAHCYLSVDDRRLDLTRPGHPWTAHLIREETIAPTQVAERKPASHRRVIAEHATSLGADPEVLWALREACIEAIAEGPG